MERSATCLFGLRQYGVDINGYVRHPTKGLCIWMQKRAADKQTWPGMMDNMVRSFFARNFLQILHFAVVQKNWQYCKFFENKKLAN